MNDARRKPKKRRRARKAADLGTAQRVAWTAVREAETMLLDTEQDVETRLRCVHALTQSLGTFAKLSEAADLEKRIEKLEAAYRKENPGTLRRAV